MKKLKKRISMMVDDNNDDTGKHYDYEIRLTKR